MPADLEPGIAVAKPRSTRRPRGDSVPGWPVCLVGPDEIVEFSNRSRLQHLGAPISKVGHVEMPLLDVQDPLDVMEVFLPVEGHLQEDY
ncbi:MAG: hypothetical protein ACKONH_05540 [Planctomycetia bacterium]